MAATTRDTFSPDNNGVTKIPIVSSTPFSSSFKEIPPPFDVPHLLEDITSNAKVGSQGDEKARKKALAAARSLCLALETPPEAIVRIAWAEPALSVAARVAIALNVFEHLSKDAGKSSSELAALTGADPVLLGRILKHLAAMGVIHEVDADSYASTSLARALTVPIYRDGIPFCFDCISPSLVKMPEYLKNTGYKSPNNSADGPFQYGHGTSLTLFQWLGGHPEIFASFNNHMSGYRQGRPSWMDPDFYPVEDRLGKGMSTDEDAVLLVDVGGGLGHDLKEFQRKHPELPGRLVLEDQPAVIAGVTDNHRRIEPMAHDFFTPQPIKGARAYYMHSVLHDWPDDRCREILINLKSAMTKGYSKILINENVIPDKGAHFAATGLDMFMMSFSSTERTDKMWYELLASVGLKVVKIWTYEQGTESLIEAELA